MRIVTNTSPLIALFQIGLLDLLERLYGRLVDPPHGDNVVAVPVAGVARFAVLESRRS